MTMKAHTNPLLLSTMQDKQNCQQRQPPKALRLRKLALAIALTLSASTPNLAQAAIYTVTKTTDSNSAGSLRKAITDANSNPGLDTIKFNIPPIQGNTINLSSELVITDSVTIKGPIEGDPSSIILDGGGSPFGNRHIDASGFPVNSGQTITLENMTLHNGYFDGSTLGSGYGGGAVFVKNADLELKNTIISGNSTKGSWANGGGLYVYSGNATLTQSTVSGNSTTSGDGGGLLVRFGDVALTQSTISGNSTTSGKGGGIYVRYGNVTLTQSTVSSNSTTGGSARGGGLYIAEGNITLVQSTFTNNSAGAGAGGISAYMHSVTNFVTLTNSILSGNLGPEDNFEDQAYIRQADLTVNFSLFGDSLSEIDVNNGALLNSSNNPDLGPLQYNGGVTQTHKPKSGSLAINAGDNTEATAFSSDQRGSGFSRKIDAQVDIGAVELQNVSGNSTIALNPNEVLTRRDLARELLKRLEGENFIPLDPNNNFEPYLVTGIYDDVDVGDINAVFIEEFQRRGYTQGCAVNKFCPDAIVTRAEMAKFFLKAFQNPNYTPPTAQGVVFYDVDLPTSFNIDWINDLDNEGFTNGCGLHPVTNDLLFCPQSPVTREWFDSLMSEI